MRMIRGQGIHGELAPRVCLRDFSVVRDLEEDGYALLPAERMDPVISETDTVDYHTCRDLQLSDHVDSQFEIMQAEGRRLGDEYDEVSIADRSDHRTRSARRGVKDGRCALVEKALCSTDERRGHGNADIEPTLYQGDAVCLGCFHHTDPMPCFSDRLLGADKGASPAAMTELGKCQGSGLERCNCMVSAETAALAAAGAERCIHLGNGNADLLASLQDTPEKEMGVRFFDIAVKELDMPSGHPCKVYGHSSFSGSPFA